MANGSYPTGINAFMADEFNWVDDDFSVAAVTDNYTYSSAHETYADIAAFVIDTGPLDGKEVANSTFYASTVAPGPVIDLGVTATKLIVFRDALPDDAASKLCFYIDRDANGMVMYRPGTGAAVPISWADSGIYTIPS